MRLALYLHRRPVRDHHAPHHLGRVVWGANHGVGASLLRLDRRPLLIVNRDQETCEGTKTGEHVANKTYSNVAVIDDDKTRAKQLLTAGKRRISAGFRR